MTVENLHAPRKGQHAVILCHPDLDSFNHAIANAYRDAVRAAGQAVVLRDLYAMGFDPVLKSAEQPTSEGFAQSADVLAELDVIQGSDVFVLIYPIWFGTPPAMMKGYIERVLASGVKPLEVRNQAPTTLLGGKRLLSLTTSAMNNIWLNEQGQEIGLRSVLDNYMVHAFGMHSQEHKRFDHVTSDLTQRFADQNFCEVVAQAQRTCGQIVFGDEALLHNPTLTRQLSQ